MLRKAGAPDQMAASPPSGRCVAKKTKVSGYKLRVRVSFPKPGGGRGLTGKLKLSKAFVQLAQRMNAIRPRVMDTGFTAKFKLRLIRIPKTVRGVIRGLATRYGLSVSKALHVAGCESGFNPNAYSSGKAGVYQQDVGLWPSRAKHLGHPGESVYDAYANIDVSLKMARGGGWRPWSCA